MAQASAKDGEAAQAPVVALLSDPASYPRPVEAVERIDTHISIVFLAGDRVYKMKRAIVLSFLDYGTLDRRRFYCECEVEINRRTAPSLYLGTVPVTREADGSLALDGAGEPVEWLVEIVRFDQDGLFSRQAEAGTLSLELVREAVDAVAEMHDGAAVVEAGAAEDAGASHGGGAADARTTAGELREGLTGFPDILDPGAVAAFLDALDAAVARQSPLLDRRLADGHVRECHGDLHLNNICMVDGRPAPFDAAEANDRFRLIDVLYDLAFLLMDLDFRGLRGHANAALDRYVARVAEPHAAIAGLAAMPLFLALRAAIRCRISAMTVGNVDDPEKAGTHREAARRYLRLAAGCLDPAPPLLLAVGGASGSGKTTVARALAPAIGAAPGALVLRTDEIRKALFGALEEERLPEAAYTAEWHARVYGEAAARARLALAAGHACVIDAVHGSPESRARTEAIAREAGVPFLGLWLDAPSDTLKTRVGARRGDASDADAGVVERQVAGGFGAIGWPRVDAGADIDTVVARARTALGL